ncbi:MAG TPA: TadG family pilus assembly protein, partial [Methylovirgula sp.]|nr:TadG family pilus assembly protein [Methylovirgula sp.]
MTAMQRLLRSFWSSESGNIILLAACTILLIAGIAALVVDVGTFYYQKRHLQTAADMAALAASTNLSNDQAAAIAALASNGYPASVLQSVTTGTYSPTASLGNRFTVGGTNPNAVKVALLAHAPVHFAPVFTLLGVPTNGGTVAIGAKSVGSTPAYAAFEIGSTLASFNGGVLNAVLGSLLGGNVSLQVMDYNSLANADIDMFQFSNALATRLHLTAGTYSSIASGSFTIGDILQAAITAAQAQNLSSTAVSALQTLVQSASSSTLGKTVNLASLVNFGPYGRGNVGGTSPVAFQVSALNLVSTVLQLANGTNQIALNLGVNAAPLA